MRRSRARRTGVRAALLLSAVLAWACRPSLPAAPSGAVRLLEELRLAEVEPPGDREMPEKHGVRRARVLPAKLSLGRVARVAMRNAAGNWEDRLALLAAGGRRYRFRLTLPEEPVLRVGLGYPPPPEGAAPSPVGFVVRVIEAGGETAVLLEEGRIRSRQGPWLDRELDLGRWAGREIRLELEVRGSESDQAAWSTPEVVSRAREEQGWDVLLVSLDTLRADRLGCYGYPRETSPHLDAFARQAWRFQVAVSQAPWTRPSHQSLFWGLYPTSRGGLAPRPLAEVLWKAGYRTEAWTGGGQMDPQMGFARGFDVYRVEDWIRQVDALAEAMTASRGPRFHFLHSYEPHDPYVDRRFADRLPAGRLDGYFDQGMWNRMRRSLTADEKAYIEALYDGDIAFTDLQLGELFRRLGALGSLERTIVVITSDHGEQFWEHGSWRHGQNLHDYQLLVPLIVRLPRALARQLGGGPAAGVIRQQVRLIDLYPTLLELLDIPLPRRVQGRSLVPLFRGQDLPEVEALAENVSLKEVEGKSLRLGRYKLIHTRRETPGGQVESVELFDLESDPQELVNLADERPELAQRLRVRLQALVGEDWISDGAKPPPVTDPELREKLRALGYVGN